MHLVYEIISKIRRENLHFSLSTNREEVITVSIVVPGERVEIDVFSDGNADIGVFKGEEVTFTDKKMIDVLIDSYKE